jgi:hypothetical protein
VRGIGRRQRRDTAQAGLAREAARQRRVAAEDLQILFAHAHARHGHLQGVHRAHAAELEEHW